MSETDLYIQRLWTPVRKDIFDGDVCVSNYLLDVVEDGKGRGEAGKKRYGNSLQVLTKSVLISRGGGIAEIAELEQELERTRQPPSGEKGRGGVNNSA